MNFTRYVGEDGVEGSRIVRPGGKVLFNTLEIRDEKLLSFVGKEVFCWDASDCVYIHTAVYRPYLTTREPPRPSQGDFITRIDSKDFIFRPSPNQCHTLGRRGAGVPVEKEKL